MIKLYPEPNLRGSINNFLYNPVQTNQVDQANARFDYRTSNSAIFGRYCLGGCRHVQSRATFPSLQSAAGPGRPGQCGRPEQASGARLRPLDQSVEVLRSRVGYSRMFQGIYDSGTKFGNIAEELGILNANANGTAPGLRPRTLPA